MSAPPPPAWLADPQAWPRSGLSTPPYEIERVRAFIDKHRKTLKWLWLGLIKEEPVGVYFRLKSCATRTEAHEKAFATLIVAALYYVDHKTRIERSSLAGPIWRSFIVGVERVNARDKVEARALAKGCLSKILAQTEALYGKPRRKVARTLTKLATGYEVTFDMARARALASREDEADLDFEFDRYFVKVFRDSDRTWSWDITLGDSPEEVKGCAVGLNSAKAAVAAPYTALVTLILDTLQPSAAQAALMARHDDSRKRGP
jgi:hypothetical protein